MARSFFTFPVIGQQGSTRWFWNDYAHLFGSSGSTFGGDAEQLYNRWPLDEFWSEKSLVIIGIDTRQAGKNCPQSMEDEGGSIHKGIWSSISWISCEQSVLPRDQVSSLRQNSLCCTWNFGKSIALINLGVKHSVLRQLSQRDCNVTVYPYDDLWWIDGTAYRWRYFIQWAWRSLSGEKLCRLIQKSHNSDLGHGLGTQVLARYGAELAPMEVGHWFNIPVREIATGKSR